MRTADLLGAWGRTLIGGKPALTIEITRQCPLRCPGCYAYDEGHLGGEGVTLRQLSDFRGDELVRRVLELVDRERPLHLSLVGGDPLVRHRELEQLLPQLDARRIHVQVVTSAFRELPRVHRSLSRLTISVSVDGLQPEHDERRKPATYERILKSIAGGRVTIHCTVTGQIAGRPGYLEEFLRFWSARPEVQRVWISLFTPQRGAQGPEILTPEQRSAVAVEFERLMPLFPKFHMNPLMIRELRHPPQSPQECIFARVTRSISADLSTRIEPCQFGGDPDCSQCGCIASIGLAAVGHVKLLPGLTAGGLLSASERVGAAVRLLHARRSLPAPPTFSILNNSK